jgi:hypothetical protein
MLKSIAERRSRSGRLRRSHPRFQAQLRWWRIRVDGETGCSGGIWQRGARTWRYVSWNVIVWFGMLQAEGLAIAGFASCDFNARAVFPGMPSCF